LRVRLNEIERLRQATMDGVRFRQAIRMMFPDKSFHQLGSLVCRPLVLRAFADQIGDPVLEGSMGKHHADESQCERL
jgi:hypothetical protein